MEFHSGHIAVAPIEKVLPALRVEEYVGVDFLSPGLPFGVMVDEGLAYRVLEGTFGAVGHSYTDLFVGGIVVEVLIGCRPFSAFSAGIGTFDDARCPSVVIRPTDVGTEIEDFSFVLPMLEVGGGEGLEVMAAPTVETIGGWVDIVALCLFSIHHFGVGIVSPDGRIGGVVEGDVVAVDALSGHCHGSNRAVGAVVEIVGTYRTAVASSVGLDGAIVIEEYPLSAETGDGRMDGVAVARHFGEQSLIGVGATDAVGHGVGQLLGKSCGKGEIVFPIPFVHPWGFGVVASRDVDAEDGAFGFHHVAFQLDGITLAVTPEKPGLSIVVDEHGGVDTYPRMGGSCTIGIGQQRTTDGIVEGSFRSVGHGHTNARTVGADVEIVFSVALDALPGIGGSATVPFEVAYAERGGVFRPMGEVGGGEDFPVLQFVVGLSAGLVVAGVKPKGVAFDHRGGVAGEEVRDERISVGLEMAKGVSFCGLPEEGEGKGQRKQGA